LFNEPVADQDAHSVRRRGEVERLTLDPLGQARRVGGWTQREITQNGWVFRQFVPRRHEGR